MMSLEKQGETIGKGGNTESFELAPSVHDMRQRALFSSVLGHPVTMAAAATLAADANFVRWLEGLVQRRENPQS